MMAWQCLCTLTVLTMCCFGSVRSECLKKASFSSYKDGHTYSKSDVEDDWGRTNGPYKMIAGGHGGPALTRIDGGALRGNFRKGKIKGYETGFTWYALHNKQFEEASMEYKIKFSPGFDWTKGGKLPGLCGGEGKAGVACPVGCSSVGKDKGFSTRLMWREDGRIVTYAYYPDKPKSIRCGEDWKWSKKVKSGKWYTIRMWSKLNTPGKKDGEFKAWLDGSQVLHKTKIRYRYNSKFKISRSYITTYAGGSSVSLFAPDKNQYIWFKDFATWSGGGSNGCSKGSKSSGSKSSSSKKSSSKSSSSKSSSSKSSGSSKRQGVGTKQASKDISGYVLVPEEAGWDVPGNIGNEEAEAESSAKGRDVLVQHTISCINACNRMSDCAGFALHADKCWFKDRWMMSAKPQFKGETSAGWRWLYAKEDQVFDQSGASGGENSEVQLALNTYQIFHQSACSSFTPLRLEDCTNSNWVITVKWAQEVQGHRLKWWGLALLDKQENTANFNPTEEKTGMCVHWGDSEEEVTEDQLSSWVTVTAKCGSARFA